MIRVSPSALNVRTETRHLESTHDSAPNAWGILVGVLAVAIGFRFAGLSRPSLWFDEAWVIWLAGHGWREILGLLRLSDAHPPLYYLFMRAWVGLADSGELAARAPSACFSSLSVVLTYALMRWQSPQPVSLLGAFLLGVSPFAVMAGQDARMYALLGALALASTLLLMISVHRGGALSWSSYVALATLLAYTHYLGILVLVSHGIWVLSFERSRLRAWLVAIAVVALLYLPWVPSLWGQLGHGNAWPWYRRDGGFVALGDLFGLLAFGGSLFGMGSYFFPGSQGPVTTALVLLPFLVALACGVLALRSRPAVLGIIVLPAAVPIGVMSALSLAGFTLYPRWFSFVTPFFAMALAHGIVPIANRFRRRRDIALVLITAALVSYAVPVFARYYLDPRFRPYPWRAAADLVRRDVRSGDFFLYVNAAAEISFTYYFRERHPSLTLVPLEASPAPGTTPGFTDTQARNLAKRYPRVWLIATPPFTSEMQRRLVPTLTSAYRVAGQHTYPAIWIHLLEASVPAPR